MSTNSRPTKHWWQFWKSNREMENNPKLEDDPRVNDLLLTIRQAQDPISTYTGVQGKDWTKLWQAEKELRKIAGPGAVAPLLAALQEQDNSVHKIAVEVLGRIGDPRAVAPLVALLKDKGPYESKKAAQTAGEVRLQAAKALGEIGDRRAVVPLIDMLLDATRPHLVEAAATALGKLGDTRAVAPLLTALASAAPHAWGSSSANLAACAAATTLGTLGDRRAIGPLEGVLSNRSADLRMAALIALPKLNSSLALDTQTVKSLITILERGTTSKASETADEASAAAEILAGHDSPEIRRALTAYHNQQTSYRSQLAQQPRDKLIAELSSIEGDRISWDHPHPEREARAIDIRAELDRRRVNDSQK